jgi:cathepsin A (carboxypeptidase C)
MAAMEACQLLADSVIGNPLHPKFNVYDIRIPCEKPPLCYDFNQSDTFLNDATVQSVLGVEGRKWVECSQEVHAFLLGDWMTNLMPQIGSILDNHTEVEVLVYSGDKDWICNWRGGEAWTHATKWTGKEDFNAEDYADWTVGGEVAGQIKQFKNLHFLRVYNAGHMVPMDQPVNALDMLQTFTANGFGEFQNKSASYGSDADALYLQ